MRFFCWGPLFEEFVLCFSHSDRIILSYLSGTFNTYDTRQFSGTAQVDPKLYSDRCLHTVSCLPLPAQ